MSLEAVSEALPELVLQTRVFLAIDPPLLSPFLYYQSMSLSLVSIIKAAAVFLLSFDGLASETPFRHHPLPPLPPPLHHHHQHQQQQQQQGRAGVEGDGIINSGI